VALMAKQRVWRIGIDSDPPADWTSVYVDVSRVHRGRFERTEPEYRNISWWENMTTWIGMQPGEYCYAFGNRKPEFDGDNRYLFKFSDPLVAFEFKIVWS
jgi:hypothetical protein